VFPGLSEYVRAIAGATLAAVHCLQQSKYEIAICWDGGRYRLLCCLDLDPSNTLQVDITHGNLGLLATAM
jgi:hypothetical protein